jgi:hypothetical protein
MIAILLFLSQGIFSSSIEFPSEYKYSMGALGLGALASVDLKLETSINGDLTVFLGQFVYSLVKGTGNFQQNCPFSFELVTSAEQEKTFFEIDLEQSECLQVFKTLIPGNPQYMRFDYDESQDTFQTSIYMPITLLKVTDTSEI